MAMETSEKTIQQIKRAINKIAVKYPPETETPQMTDIFLVVNQETGDMMAFDDNDKELDRCVIEEWMIRACPQNHSRKLHAPLCWKWE